MIHFPYRLRILVQVHSIWSHFMRTSVFRWQFVFAGCSARQRRPSPSNRVWGSRNHGKMALTALTTSSASFLSAVTFNRLQVAWWENNKIWEIHQPFVVRCVHETYDSCEETCFLNVEEWSKLYCHDMETFLLKTLSSLANQTFWYLRDAGICWTKSRNSNGCLRTDRKIEDRDVLGCVDSQELQLEFHNSFQAPWQHALLIQENLRYPVSQEGCGSCDMVWGCKGISCGRSTICTGAQCILDGRMENNELMNAIRKWSWEEHLISTLRCRIPICKLWNPTRLRSLVCPCLFDQLDRSW